MSARSFGVLPDPGAATDLDDLVERLRSLKRWAGDPSYRSITARVNESWAAAGRPAAEAAAKNTVADCFRPGRRRLNPDLVVAVVEALHPDVGYAAQWRQALRVVGGEVAAAAQVRVQDSLPPDLGEFTGRAAELNRLGQALGDGDTVMISAIAGMAGIGKTRLAVHAGHLLVRRRQVERVLFVNLRGFHPDPAQPPADPAAVLDGFLRLLGLVGHQIPHELSARSAAFRDRLAGTRTLVVLDDAADADQIRPLVPRVPGCPTLITGRRRLRLGSATHLTMDVFTPAEAQAYLARAAPDVPAGADPRASARIAVRCGHLPLALGLVTGHIRAMPGWTLTDHADRLDERHADRRLDSDVERALDLSYRRLTAAQQRLLRLLAVHPGHDFDAYAAAALAAAEPPAVRAQLRRLTDDYLLQQPAPGRYLLHDLVRAYAARRAGDEDPRSERRAALTRLFDYYQAACAAATDVLHLAEHHPPAGAPADSPMPALTDPATARAWLDTERPTLVAVAIHAADHGWPGHTVRLSATLFRYLASGYLHDAVTLHDHAGRAARQLGDPVRQAHALTNLGVAYLQLGRHDAAATELTSALGLFRRATDPSGEARTLNNLGIAAKRLGDYRAAAGHCERALALFRRAGEHTNAARTLSNLGALHERLGDYAAATGRLRQALELFRRTGVESGAAHSLHDLGVVDIRLGRYADAETHLKQSLDVFRRLGHRDGQGWAIDGLGLLHVHRGAVAAARDHFAQALAIHRETGDREGEAAALNGLGETARAAGRAAESHRRHTEAYAIAAATGDRFQQARAHAGLGHAHLALGAVTEAREHAGHAVRIHTALGTTEAARESLPLP